MSVETNYSDNTLTVRKTFSQPVATVFDALIDAAKTTHWWGCANTTKVVSVVDAESGGRYCHTMTIDGVGNHTIAGRLNLIRPADQAGLHDAGQ
ncbi:SRPBCC domain-containing protein [Yoonia sp. 2307UL14-13]